MFWRVLEEEEREIPSRELEFAVMFWRVFELEDWRRIPSNWFSLAVMPWRVFEEEEEK